MDSGDTLWDITSGFRPIGRNSYDVLLLGLDSHQSYLTLAQPLKLLTNGLQTFDAWVYPSHSCWFFNNNNVVPSFAMLHYYALHKLRMSPKQVGSPKLQ